MTKNFKINKGTLFSYQIYDERYVFGRFIGHVEDPKNRYFNHVVEIFDYVSEDAQDYQKALGCGRMFYPCFLFIDDDSPLEPASYYDYQIIELGDDSYITPDYEDIKLYYLQENRKKYLYRLTGDHLVNVDMSSYQVGKDYGDDNIGIMAIDLKIRDVLEKSGRDRPVTPTIEPVKEETQKEPTYKSQHVWVGENYQSEQDYDAYFELDYDTEDMDSPDYKICPFCLDIGEQWFDHDLICILPRYKTAEPVENIVAELPLACSDEMEKVVQQCKALGITQANAAFSYSDGTVYSESEQETGSEDKIIITDKTKKFNGLTYIGVFKF